MNRFYFFIFFFLFVFILNRTYSKENNRYDSEFYYSGNNTSVNEIMLAGISATISGSISVCQHSTKPNVIFTGSGGTPPYLFTYKINSGPELNAISVAGSNSATLRANTDSAGVYIYTITKVSDNAANTQPLSVKDTITVNALPVIGFTFTDQQCSGTGVVFKPSLTGAYSYAWDFGDGTTSTKVSPTHLYATSGISTQDYTVKLTQTDTTTTCQSTVLNHVVVAQVPDATLNGSGSGWISNGVQGFRICSESDSATFTFLNASTTAGTNTNYSINWGDKTPDFTAATWTSITHTYKAGMFVLSFTVIGPNGCKTVKKYNVFDGYTPVVTLINPGGLNVCISQTLTFAVTGTENNSKGTTYTVSFNDGSKDTVYTTAPAQITHKFLKSSCGVNILDGTNSYQNSFYVKITASNPCGISVSPVLPIYVSVPPTADFIVPATNTCLNTPVCLTNSSKNGSAIIGGNCTTNSNLIWKITPATGYTLQSGSFGNDFGSTDPGSWSSGSNAICPVFTTPGVYTISMKIGNRCDIDTKTKTICVAAPLIPQFDLSSTGGCTPFNVNITNKTDTTQSCSSTFKWTVKYTAKYCGTTWEYTYTSGNSTSFNPSFEFTKPGIYSIQLTATNSCGTQQSTPLDVTVTEPPVVSIDSIPGSCGQPIHPVAHVASCSLASDVLTYRWDFPGGNPGTSTNLDPGEITYGAIGNYTVTLTVTNACGIPVKAVRTFEVKPVPILTNTALTQTICSGFTPDSVKLTSNLPLVKYSWTAIATPGITGFIGSGTTPVLPTAPIFNSGNTQGTVIYTITPSLNGCLGDTVDYVIKVNPAPNISNPKSFDICIGSIPDTLSVVATNGLGIPTFQWYRNTVNNNTTGTQIAGALNATYVPPTVKADTMYYYCVVTYPTGLCPSIQSQTARVIVSAYPVISNYSLIMNSGETFTFSPNTLNGDIIPAGTKYTWSLPGLNPLNSITGATGQSIPQAVLTQTLTSTTVAPATATYTVTPASGMCQGKDFNLTVTVIHSINPNVILKNISCFGAHNGSLQTAIEGGVPFVTGNPYHITWTGPNGFSSTDASISNLYKGNYTLVIKDSNDSVFSKIYVITEPSELNLKVVTTRNVSCFGSSDGEIAVQVTGGTLPYTYNWEKDATPFTGIGTGTAEIKNLGPGIYKVTVTDSLNCGPKVFSDTITEKPGMSIILNQSNLKCYGDSTGTISVKVSGGKPFVKSPGVLYYDYSWTGPNGYTSTDQNLTHLVGGIYTLTVTDSTGCHQTFNDTITQPAEIIIHVITTPITCYGENNASIKLDSITGGIPPYQIQWSNLGKGMFQTNLSPGKYTVTVTDFAGCQKSKDIVIGESNFAIQPTFKNVTCFGAHNGSINLNLLGSTAMVSLVWDDDPTAGVTRNQLGPGIYKVTLRDTSACVIIQSFHILEPPAIDVSAAITNAFDCLNPNSGAISLTITGGTGSYQFLWSNGKTTKDLTAIQGGTYDVTVTDSLGCNVIKSFVVARPDPIALSVDITPDFNCQTKVISETCTAKITGGIPPYQCSWSSGTPDPLNNQIMRTTQSGMIVLTVVDGRGCTANYTFSVSIPDAGINTQLISCDNRVLAFTATIPSGVAGDYSFLWDFGDGKTETIQNPQHTFTTSGTYKVSLTMQNATCTAVYEKTILVEPTPVLVLDKLPIFCIGDSLMLHVSGADTYQWSNGSTGDSTLIKQAGDYFVTGTSKAGCTGTLTFKMTNFNTYNYTIQTDREEVSTANPTLQLWSQSITYSDYFWDFGDGITADGNNQTHTYNILKDGYYDVKLKVQNPNGCLEFATKRIWITNTTTGNVFTPNGDGVDDIFMKGWHIQVYNRNGILIYEGTEGWDGTFKGKPVSNDTYFYVLYVTGASGVKTRTGFVTVVR